MKNLKSRLEGPWVPGWLTEGGLLVATVICTCIGAHELAAIYLTGSMVIGVMRQIERARDGEGR